MAEGEDCDPGDLIHYYTLQLKMEKDRRCYYQTIVYEVCTILDRNRHDGRMTVSGTIETPSTNVQDTLKSILSNMEPIL